MRTFQKTLWDARYVLLVAGLTLLGKAIFILLASLKGLSLTSWIIDDAFIEMAVAQSIALGHGFSYDFVHPTTGSPFLWTYLMSLCFLFFKQTLAVKMSLILSGFFASLATIVTYFFTLHITQNKKTAWIAFLLTTFSGNAFLEAVNGMDTAIFTFFTVLAFALYAGTFTSHLSPLRRGLLTGIAVGCGLMTRGDGIFVAGTIGLMELWNIFVIKKENSSILHSPFSILHFFRRDKHPAHLLLGVIATSFIGWAIITIWEIKVTGSPFLANQIGRRAIALEWNHFSFSHFELLPYLHIVIWNVFMLEKLFTVATGATLLCIVALLYGFVKKETRQAATMTSIYLVTFCGVLVAYQWYFPNFHGLRYINPGVHLLFIFVAWMLTELFSGRRAWIPLTIATAGISILSLYAYYDLANSMPWAPVMSMTAQPTQKNIDDLWGPLDWARTHVPAGSVVGVRDHGRIALFTGLPIQDIAGNIDPNVPAILNGPDAGTKLKQYFHDRHVDYLFLLAKGVRPDRIYQVIYANFTLEKIPEASRGTSEFYRIAWEKMSL